MESFDKKTQGAWLVHHFNKLQGVAQTIEFQEIEFAGKCGVLLSALAADKQSSLDKKAVEGMAKAAKLNVHTDLPAILNKLKDRQLVDVSQTGAVEVLGLTTSSVLSHTADIFESTEPNPKEQAALQLSEETSKSPESESKLKQWISDKFQLTQDQSSQLLDASAAIGFVDSEHAEANERLFFNGNLFRVDNSKKIAAILDSLKPADRKLMQEVEALLIQKGCVEEPEVRKMLGDQLFGKLQSIGIFDVSSVNNNTETCFYVTRPGAFGKFGSVIANDAFDLAKAFVASLTYGMTRSVSSRGKITLLNFLLDKLIRGEELRPSTAAGQDYKVLEMKGVVKVTPAGGGTFKMRLLKREVGELAKRILNFGDASEASLTALPGASVISYQSPEVNRSIKRRSLPDVDKSATATLLRDIRTGAFR